MAVTLKDVAERAGVSRSAVSRTFTAGASVSDKMRRKVEKAARDLGYSPNALASSLTTGRTKLIGLVSDNFHNPFFLEIFDLFTRALQDRGLRPLLLNLSGETNPKNAVRMMQQYSVDGVVVASSTLPPSFAQIFGQAGIPVVHAFGRRSSEPQGHVVDIDNIECGRMAARTLMARGYTHVAFFGGPESATSTQDRYTGFVSEMAKHPQITTSYSFASDYSFDAGHREMRRLLAAGPAQAYFGGDDVISIGALAAMQEHGLRVPEDIGIIGLNDMAMARWQNINLTTIHQPIRDIVSSSVDLMTSLLTDEDRHPESRIFSCHVVERGTLRPKHTAQAF